MKTMTIASLFAGLALAGAANASNVVLNETLDLTTAQQNYGFTAGWRGFSSFSPPFGFDLAAGDSLDFTIDFKGGQTLTLNNPTFFWAFSYTNDASSSVNGTGTLSFLDASGAAFLTSNLKTDNEAAVHFGQNYGSSDFGALPANLTFYGLRYSGVLNSYSNPSVTSRHYADPQVLFNAGSAVVSGGVPEPATWALMISGFGLVGASMRRRKVAA